MRKPLFYQAVLKPIKGNVLDELYPLHNTTMTERMGDELATCPECVEQGIVKPVNRWMLLAKEGVARSQGGKPYIECLDCGYITHL